MTPVQFLNIINKKDNMDMYKLGKIDPAYLEGRPRIIFDGEDVPSQKRYTYLDSYTPRGSDRVLMAIVKGTYVILGKVI